MRQTPSSPRLSASSYRATMATSKFWAIHATSVRARAERPSSARSITGGEIRCLLR
jgi:hypothetical protein